MAERRDPDATGAPAAAADAPASSVKTAWSQAAKLRLYDRAAIARVATVLAKAQAASTGPAGDGEKPMYSRGRGIDG